MDSLQSLLGKKVHVGVIDLRDLTPESPELVAQRIRAALEFLPAERMVIAPDCGMKYLPRDVAYSKLANMVLGRNIVRDELENR